MATAQQVLNVARGEIGYSRWNDPQQGTKYGRWYATFGGSYYGTNGVPYCAMFVSWCLAQCGMTPPGGYFAYVPYGINAARSRGKLVSKANAKPGDLVCFDWGGDGVADHVGFVESNNPSAGTMTCIEGNTSPGTSGSQSNGGGVYRRARYYSQICNIIRPDYSSATSTSASPSSSATAVTDILEVIMTAKATHSVFQWKGGIYCGNLLTGTYWRFKNPDTMNSAITLLKRAGMKVVYHRSLTAAGKSDVVENPHAYGVYMGEWNVGDGEVK